MTYAANGNGLETDATSAAGTIRSTVDLDGRVGGYQDVWGRTAFSLYDTAGDVTVSRSDGRGAQAGYGRPGHAESRNSKV